MPRRTSGRLRVAKQKLRARYSREREDRQLAGIEPTVPTGAVHDERVDPAQQTCQVFPELVRAALRQGWNVPEHVKAQVIAELTAAATNPTTDPRLRIRLVSVLHECDRLQYERDHVITR